MKVYLLVMKDGWCNDSEATFYKVINIFVDYAKAVVEMCNLDAVNDQEHIWYEVIEMTITK